MADKEFITQLQPDEVKKPGYVMIKGMPCRITDIEQVKLATANGNKKLKITGLHVFTGKKLDDTFNLSAGFKGIDAPITEKHAYTLVDVDTRTGFISLLDGDDIKEDTKLCRSEDGKEFDELGTSIVTRFEEGEALKITVLTIMGQSIVIEAVKDVDSA